MFLRLLWENTNMKLNIVNIAVVLTLLVSACGQKKAEQFQALPFPDVFPPAMMDDVQDRAEFMAMNMWNGLLDTSRHYPCDSLLVSGVRKADVEQKFVNWIQVLDMVGRNKAEKAIGKLYDKALFCERTDASSNVFEAISNLVETYLFDANSPYRDEDYYGMYAERLAGYEGLQVEMRGKYARDARLCALNRVGTKATDFNFADRRGKIHTLYGIESPYTLLFFSNPGCEACMNIITVLKEEPTIAQMISSGRLVVLNIYIDEDLEAWRSYMPIYPSEWYNGFDPEFVIRSETLYNVRAIPSLYLLDQDKTVLLKDVPENRMFDYIMNL